MKMMLDNLDIYLRDFRGIGNVFWGKALFNPETDSEIKRISLERENNSAVILSENGYTVEQSPQIGLIRDWWKWGKFTRKDDSEFNYAESKNLSIYRDPDYRINGVIYDCYAPNWTGVWAIYDGMQKKIRTWQTKNIILNLEWTRVSAEEVLRYLSRYTLVWLVDLKIVTQEWWIVELTGGLENTP
jgi:filamentous hemagglutinin